MFNIHRPREDMSGSSAHVASASTILPKRPRQIEDVGKASMVDLRAATYASEETVRRPDGTARVAEERRQKELKKDPLGGAGARNQGVATRAAADISVEREEAQRVEEALTRKAALYERMARGEIAVDQKSDGLVDFELKELTSAPADEGAAAVPPAAGRAAVRSEASPFAPPPPPGAELRDERRLDRDERRLDWERSAREELREGRPARDAGEGRYGSDGAARRAEVIAVTDQQTEPSSL